MANDKEQPSKEPSQVSPEPEMSPEQQLEMERQMEMVRLNTNGYNRFQVLTELHELNKTLNGIGQVLSEILNQMTSSNGNVKEAKEVPQEDEKPQVSAEGQAPA